MSKIQQYVGKVINIEVVGGRHHEGVLVDYGPDIIVIFDNRKYYYYYIPLTHLKHLGLSSQENPENEWNFKNKPISSDTGLLSFRKIIEKAKDILLELYVTGNHPVYGYITNILSDYLLFNSTVYKTIAINISHIKWLALSNRNQTYYSKDRKDLHVQSTLNAIAAPTFEQQLDKMIGNIIVIDADTGPSKVGLVVSVSSEFIELIIANEETHLLNINHIKMFHI
ncbi:hypothetical protein [Pelotomaculum propionicicum]|uniref:DUF2642 domain-containing protein n=1 Tax=Pelotomaculum propionicicum TaxID=258475 RepID=A0A4Y7RU99_9FIRM|nr:hypothetical protein [Pelotomaculum propionicicum]NLI14057.1 hypothetical protein [Peptococcaceae bacterium]TEB12574.1 hypothetical protein Pmgp_00905 [Pelotomaculum propionicicum]